MDRRELRYMRMYGKYLGIVFVMLERQSKVLEVIIAIASFVIIVAIFYLVGIGIMGSSTTAISANELLRFWAVWKGFLTSFVSLLIVFLIVAFANEIYKEYQSARSDYARKERG